MHEVSCFKFTLRGQHRNRRSVHLRPPASSPHDVPCLPGSAEGGRDGGKGGREGGGRREEEGGGVGG